MYTSSVARKYALAFMKIHSPHDHPDTWIKFSALDLFFDTHRRYCTRLASLGTSAAVQLQILQQIKTSLELPDIFMRLCQTLVEHQRLELLRHIVHQLVKEHDTIMGLVKIDATTSHPLSQEQYDILYTFAQQVFAHHNVRMTARVNVGLLCGIQLHTENQLWEESIAKNLTHAEQLLRQRIQI